VVLDLVAAGATLSGLSLVTIAEHAGVSRNSLYLDVLDAVRILVAPVLARLGAGTVETLDPAATSRRIVDLLYGGITAH
jgi:hypothetical protein